MSRAHVALAWLGLALAGLLSLAGPVSAENACLQDVHSMVSTAAGDDGGIGGTGLSEGGSDDDSGIGGTGLSGDDSGIGGTGIYGTITNFGSLCVNGLRVHYGDDAAVEVNGRAAPADRLAVGQVVWVEAFAQGEDLFAEKISVLSAAIGSVEALEPHQGRLRVNHEWVEVPEEAIVLDASGGVVPGLSGLSLGDIVDVSGLRRSDRHIVASRLEVTTEAEAEGFEGLELSDLLREARQLAEFSVEGYVGAREGPGRFRLDGVEIDTSALPDLRAIEVDARVWLTGARVGDAKLRVHRVRVHRVGAPDRLSSSLQQDAGAAARGSDPKPSGAPPHDLASPGGAVEESGAGPLVEPGASTPSPAPPSPSRPPDRVDPPRRLEGTVRPAEALGAGSVAEGVATPSPAPSSPSEPPDRVDPPRIERPVGPVRPVRPVDIDATERLRPAAKMGR